jgi:hypothetical protein
MALYINRNIRQTRRVPQDRLELPKGSVSGGSFNSCHTVLMARQPSVRGPATKTGQRNFDSAARKMTDIVVRHLETMSPDEQENRIKALEKRFPA